MEFQKFQKIPRYSREVIVTEKIDGTNSQIIITPGGELFTGSRNRYITPEDDNFGFSRWAHEHKDELMQLGPGRHYGEWWGQGIQRKYGLNEKRFSLFDIKRHSENRPECCDIIPIIWRGLFDNLDVNLVMRYLEVKGSYAAPGFMKPEGIIIYHTHGNLYFKKTFENDEKGKG